MYSALHTLCSIVYTTDPDVNAFYAIAARLLYKPFSRLTQTCDVLSTQIM